MKVVILCGGLGTRLREETEFRPKPMVPVGGRPLLWHIMKFYAHFGFKEFVLCLGYKGEVIKEYFLGYNEALTNDFILSDGGRRIDLLSEDIRDWKITFVDTGPCANIGERLKAGGITQLIFAGVTTEVCVQTSMREANDRGYECLLIEDATASYFPAFKQAAIDMIRAQGAIVGWTTPLAGLIAANRA